MNKRYIIASHITDLEGPTEALVQHLKYINASFKAILLPMHYCTNRRVRLISSESGEIFYSQPYTSGFVVSCIKDFLITIRILIIAKKNNEDVIYIGVDPLNCLAGLLLKAFGRVDKVIFYTIDWMPDRFQNPILNSIYHFIDKVSSRCSDITWNLTEKINEIRNKYTKNTKKNIIVPVGAYIQDRSINVDLDSYNVVLLGALTPSKGVDLIVQAWPLVLQNIPHAKLHIIGKTPNDAIEDGIKYEPYESSLSNLGNSVILHGVLKRTDVYRKLVSMDLGLALYKPTLSNLSNWADPSRVKDYLASGVPVLITDVPPIARDVNNNNCGMIIPYEPKSLADTIISHLNNQQRLRTMSRNSTSYMQNFTWHSIFSKVIPCD